jgi:hypothetical protein
MTEMSFKNIIQQWFKDEWGGSLLLPDGWYGRPFDNQHSLTSVEEMDETLIMVLDQKLRLRFDGLKAVQAKKGELTFGPFDRLHFEWESFGTDGKRGVKDYQVGEMKILKGSC